MIKHITWMLKISWRNGMNPYRFIEVLTSYLKEDAIVVAANATAFISLFQAAIVKKGQRMFSNSGCAAMGWGLSAAIGACIASDCEVICLEGDGSIMMNLQELQTIKHYDLPIKVFVLNNNGYHSQQETQENYFKGDYIGSTLTDISFPDFKKVADTFDMKYFKIQNENEIENVLNYSDRFLCEVILDSYKFRKQII